MHRGVVVLRAPELVLRNVEFRVSEPGRQRVLRQRRKNLHAYCVSDELPSSDDVSGMDGEPRCRVHYDPYECGYFFWDAEGGARFHAKTAEVVHLTRGEGIQAQGVIGDLV